MRNTSSFTEAVLLFVFGSVVSISGFYFRPIIINRSEARNVAIIVMRIFGGLVVFGAMGLFVGPVVLGGAKVVLDLFAQERAGRILQYLRHKANGKTTIDDLVDRLHIGGSVTDDQPIDREQLAIQL